MNSILASPSNQLLTEQQALHLAVSIAFTPSMLKLFGEDSGLYIYDASALLNKPGDFKKSRVSDQSAKFYPFFVSSSKEITELALNVSNIKELGELALKEGSPEFTLEFVEFYKPRLRIGSKGFLWKLLTNEQVAQMIKEHKVKHPSKPRVF